MVMQRHRVIGRRENHRTCNKMLRRYSRKIFRAGNTAPAMLWNAQAMEFTNASDANQYLRREYRDGWALPNGEV